VLVALLVALFLLLFLLNLLQKWKDKFITVVLYLLVFCIYLMMLSSAPSNASLIMNIIFRVPCGLITCIYWYYVPITFVTLSQNYWRYTKFDAYTDVIFRGFFAYVVLCLYWGHISLHWFVIILVHFSLSVFRAFS
jgi:hypothetical protein